MRDSGLGTDTFAEEVREEERDGTLFDGVENDEGEEDVEGFPCLQDNEVRRLKSGRVEEAKLSLTESIRPSRGTKGEDLK